MLAGSFRLHLDERIKCDDTKLNEDAECMCRELCNAAQVCACNLLEGDKQGLLLQCQSGAVQECVLCAAPVYCFLCYCDYWEKANPAINCRLEVCRAQVAQVAWPSCLGPGCLGCVSMSGGCLLLLLHRSQLMNESRLVAETPKRYYVCL